MVYGRYNKGRLRSPCSRYALVVDILGIFGTPDGVVLVSLPAYNDRLIVCSLSNSKRGSA